MRSPSPHDAHRRGRADVRPLSLVAVFGVAAFGVAVFGVAAFGRDRRGAIAILFAISLAALAGTLALALDLGRAWNLQSQLEAAADAAALAAATQLDGSTGARQRAIQAASGALARNIQVFATDGLGVEVLFDPSQGIDPDSGKTANQTIRFFTGLPLSDPANEASSDAGARLVQVTAPARRLDFSLAALVGATRSVTPQARAAATWQRLYCDTPPILVCNPNEDPGGDPAASFDPATACGGGSCVGRGITLRQHTGSGSLAPGEWGLLTLTIVDPASGSTTVVSDANALGAALAQAVTPQTCAPDARITIGPAAPADIADRINVRLDIFAAGLDRNDANLQPAVNTIKGLVLPPGWTSGTGQCRYTTVGGMPDPSVSDWLPPANTYDGPGLHANLTDPAGANYNPIDTMGYPRDACAYPGSQVDESVFGPIQGGNLGLNRVGVISKIKELTLCPQKRPQLFPDIRQCTALRRGWVRERDFGGCKPWSPGWLCMASRRGLGRTPVFLGGGVALRGP